MIIIMIRNTEMKSKHKDTIKNTILYQGYIQL